MSRKPLRKFDAINSTVQILVNVNRDIACDRNCSCLPRAADVEYAGRDELALQ